MKKSEMTYITFFGGIGVGKTTTGREICKLIDNAIFIEEKVEQNIFLDRFYHDMKSWGFHSTIAMLALMSSYYNQIDYKKRIAILDNGIPELIVYATLEHEMGILSDDEFSTYKKLYENMVNLAPPIDLHVFFYCDSELSLERIKRRGRDCEKPITIDFLERLNEKYHEWVKTLPQDKVLYINTNNGIDLNDLKNKTLEFVESLQK